MKFSLYSKKNLFDEMQEQTMRRIEARGFWLLWAGLLLAILVQIVLRTPSSQWVGEFVVFMTGCCYSLIECLRNSLWDCHFCANTTQRGRFLVCMRRSHCRHRPCLRLLADRAHSRYHRRRSLLRAPASLYACLREAPQGT